MTTKISNQFRLLLAQKALKEQRNISMKEVSRKTGVSWSALNAWANNKVTRYDAPIIDAICDYFDCEVGELIIREREK